MCLRSWCALSYAYTIALRFEIKCALSENCHIFILVKERLT